MVLTSPFNGYFLLNLCHKVTFLIDTCKYCDRFFFAEIKPEGIVVYSHVIVFN